MKPTRRASARQSLSTRAYNYLIQKLLSNQLNPGDFLNRRQIAEELGMSVAPVLEAVVHLENDGFLESLPRKGTLVKSIRAGDFRGQLILREAIECEAARLYCGEPVTREMEKLKTLAVKVDKRNDNAASWKAEFSFHRALIVLADCDQLLIAYDKMMLHKFFVAMHLYIKAHPASERGDHLKLLKELETHDPDEAERTMRTHIRAGKDEWLSQ